jgi:phosphoglycolate phosphatase
MGKFHRLALINSGSQVRIGSRRRIIGFLTAAASSAISKSRDSSGCILVPHPLLRFGELIEDCQMSSDLPAILLDLDGTLIASESGILSSCRAALRVLGHETDPAMDIASIIGPPIEDVMRYLLRQFGDDRVLEAVEAYRQDYGARGLLLSQVYDGIPDALLAMRQSARLYLATSKRETFARRILENKGLDALFAGIYGSTPYGNIDHKPELIAHIMHENGLNRDHCVMVGDRRYDIAGAHANGIRSIGVLWGYGTRDELESAGAALLIETPAELPAAAAITSSKSLTLHYSGPQE